jgi:DNA-binding IclR family transcriptional regulator
MLLQLFVVLADNETMPKSILIKQVGMSPSTGRRWLTHLVTDQQITALSDGGDVTLTEDAIDRMRAFLDEASLEAHKIEDQSSERSPGRES